MKSKKTICKVCGDEFEYFQMAKSAMDVKNVPPICDKKMCVTNWEYRKKTRNMQTGEYMDIENINKL